MEDEKKFQHTEWIFCRNNDGECVGLAPDTVVLEKKPKTIIVHGKKVKGWDIKIVQVDSEGHYNVDYKRPSDE